MLKRVIIYPLIFISTLALLSCNNPEDKRDVDDDSTTNIFLDKGTATVKDTTDNFKNAVDSLVTVDYFISGKDSVIVSKDPTDLNEMNQLHSCFQNPFDKSDTGLVYFKQVDKVRKFHVAKNKKQNGPSADIIQISFEDTLSTSRWFNRLRACKDFPILTMKPKKEIWLQGNQVYFIQSYHDPDGKILNTIFIKFKQSLANTGRKR